MKSIEEIDLINFHHLGMKRYEYIQRPYPMGDAQPLEKSRLEAKKQLVESTGLRCKISS